MTRYQIAPDWARALAPVQSTIDRLMDELYATSGTSPSPSPTLPAPENVLRAFSLPLAKVKAVIVGQDPYPTPGNSMGLAFSVEPNVAVPRSLVNIFKELNTDLDLPIPTNGDLTSWHNEGVLLLNRVLTVPAGYAGGHRKIGWEDVTGQALQALAQRGGPLVAILWGKDAEKAGDLLADTPKIVSAHPSPLSARRGFFGSRPFSRANTLLAEQGGHPINWRLPDSPDNGQQLLFDLN